MSGHRRARAGQARIAASPIDEPRLSLRLQREHDHRVVVRLVVVARDVAPRIAPDDQVAPSQWRLSADQRVLAQYRQRAEDFGNPLADALGVVRQQVRDDALDVLGELGRQDQPRYAARGLRCGGSSLWALGRGRLSPAANAAA